VKALIDTNILLRHFNRTDPFQSAVTRSLARMVDRGVTLCVCAQNIFEFWAVATRPAGVNGLGHNAAATRRNVDVILETFELLPDPPDLVARWLEICTRHEVAGKPSHDARLVALMEAAGVEELLTRNIRDFARFNTIRARDPVESQ
jgi:predicted nucleic acid-binding protein